MENKEKQLSVFNKENKKSTKKIIIGLIVVVIAFVFIFTTALISNICPQQEISTPQSYAEIEEMFLEHANDSKRQRAIDSIKNKIESIFYFDDMVVYSGNLEESNGSTSFSDSSSNSSNVKNGSYGETNEQVQGVNEADIIKNDGKYIYIIRPKLVMNEDNYSGSRDDSVISILSIQSDGTIEEVGQINIDSEEINNAYYAEIEEIYVKGNSLIAIMSYASFEYTDDRPNSSYFDYYDLKHKTIVICFDIANKTKIKESWRTYQDGTYISSRLIDDQLITFSQYRIYLYQDNDDIVNNCIPKTSINKAEMDRMPLDCITVDHKIKSSSYLVASTIDISDEKTYKTHAVLGAGDNIYCTTETLYVVEDDYAYEEDSLYNTTSTQKTNILKFDIKNGNINYIGCGTVDGHTLNQFSIDEYNGYLRIATTSTDWGNFTGRFINSFSLINRTNQVYVLDSNLNIVGKITDIAPDEEIKSVRFNGDTGYVVTFKQTDPLFVIDLADPQNPKIKGELKIPGFSTYLHPVSDNLLLGVGVDGTEERQGSGMKISLFDVSDPSKPVEVDKIEFNGLNTDERYLYFESDAFYTHKALCWDSNENIMYIPYARKETTLDPLTYKTLSNENIFGIAVIKVDPDNKKILSEGDYIYDYVNPDNNTFTTYGFDRVTYINDIIVGFCPQKCICTFEKGEANFVDIYEFN